MNHVFLSHSSKDHDSVLELYDELIKLGFRVWFDEVSMEPGDSLIEKIGIGIRSSMNLAVLLSENSVNSRWVQKEVSVALSGQLAGSEIKVVPIRLDDAELPTFLIDTKYVDFRAKANVRLEFGRLVKMLLSTYSQDGVLLRLVSLNSHVTASDQHQKQFGPSHVLSPSNENDPKAHRTYWLTTDDTKATISLNLHRSYPIRLIRLLNTQNQKHKDRASRFISIGVVGGGNSENIVWKGAIPKYDTWLDIWFESIYANTVNVHVEEWEGLGGGLNCIQVYSED